MCLLVQIISVSSLKGGVGKTSVTLGLASAALAAGVRTLVVDLDPHADASTGLGVSPNATEPIGELLKSPRKASIDSDPAPSAWTAREQANGNPNAVLDVLPGSAMTGYYDRPDIRTRDLKRLQRVLEGAEKHYDLVLIDCPPSLSGLTRMAWYTSDGVLLVAEPALFSVAGTERALRALKLFRDEFHTTIDTYGVIANRYRRDSSEHAFRLNELSVMFGEGLVQPPIPETPNWQQIQGAAYAVHHWPGSAARDTAGAFEEALRTIAPDLPQLKEEKKRNASRRGSGRRSRR